MVRVDDGVDRVLPSSVSMWAKDRGWIPGHYMSGREVVVCRKVIEGVERRVYIPWYEEWPSRWDHMYVTRIRTAIRALARYEGVHFWELVALLRETPPDGVPCVETLTAQLMQMIRAYLAKNPKKDEEVLRVAYPFVPVKWICRAVRDIGCEPEDGLEDSISYQLERWWTYVKFDGVSYKLEGCTFTGFLALYPKEQFTYQFHRGTRKV